MPKKIISENQISLIISQKIIMAPGKDEKDKNELK